MPEFHSFLRYTERNRDRAIEAEIYCKELSHGIVGTGKSNTCRVGRQGGVSGRVDIAVRDLPKAACTQARISLRGRSVLYVRSPTPADWLRPSSVLKSNLRH